jgi:glycosyltransferase involved in cell wall biosynthesis
MAADAARILLIAAATSTTGGGEHHIADLLRRLPERGFDVSLLCPPGGDLPRLAESLGIRVVSAPVDSAFPVAGVRAVRAAVAQLRPHVVHAHGSRAAFYARMGDPSAARRCVYTMHGIEAGLNDTTLLRTRRLGTGRVLRSRTARFVCVCEADCQKGTALGLIDADRAVVIHNGIELPEPVEPGTFRGELGLGERVPLVLSVGQLRAQKDQVTLIDAWARVSVRFTTAVLALVGSGPLESRLRDLANERSVAHSLRFVAPRPDLRPAYTDANMFVLSSRWEGLPYVVLEAMSHGLPVISTAVDGIPEAVIDRRTGLLVPAADPRTLAEALMWAIAEPDKAARLGVAGRERVAAEFALDTMVDKLVAVYRDVAGVRGASPAASD